MELSKLIHPFDLRTFKDDYWEKQPLRVQRNERDYYRRLLSLADVDHLLSLSSIQPSAVRVVRAGKDIPVGTNGTGGLIGTAGRLEELYGAYRDGATIVLQFLHERWEPLRRMCRSLAAELSGSLQVNIYLTPGKERGLNVHYDSHDVFVLQSEGVKHWCLYESSIRLPLRGQPYDSRTMKPGALLQEFDLHPGDLLYIPRGWMHAAESREAASLHLTVGVNTVTWASVILRAVEAVIEGDEGLRASLPLGFAREPRLQEQVVAELRSIVGRLGDAIDASSAVREAVAEAQLGRQPALDGHLLDLGAVPAINLATSLQRRPDVQWSLDVHGETAALHFHGKSIALPAYAQPELSFIARTDAFTGADLPGELDDEGRLTLIRTLVREGFLTVCREPATN
jgi:ribosomal protein L16 Arg81 hydroxylase